MLGEVDEKLLGVYIYRRLILIPFTVLYRADVAVLSGS